MRRSGSWELLPRDGEWVVAPGLTAWGTAGRLSYRKRGDGIVELLGHAVKPAGYGLFVLPVGMRPGALSGADIRTPDANGAVANFVIRSSGSVEYTDNTANRGIAIDYRFRAMN